MRRIQQLRKDTNLAISDRIVTYVADSAAGNTAGETSSTNGDGLIHEMLTNFGSYVREETLTVDLVQIHPGQGNSIPTHLPSATFELGDSQVTIAVIKK